MTGELQDQRVVVIGQGYVGLPVAIRACEVGFDVVGLDHPPVGGVGFGVEEREGPAAASRDHRQPGPQAVEDASPEREPRLEVVPVRGDRAVRLEQPVAPLAVGDPAVVEEDGIAEAEPTVDLIAKSGQRSQALAPSRPGVHYSQLTKAAKVR